MAACGARLTLRDRSACKTVPECVDLDGFGSDAVVVGRSRKDADVCLDLPPPSPACLISRQHAKLRADRHSSRVHARIGAT